MCAIDIRVGSFALEAAFALLVLILTLAANQVVTGLVESAQEDRNRSY